MRPAAVLAAALVCLSVRAEAGDAPQAPAIRLSKQDGRFLLDVTETLPVGFAKLKPILADLAAYPDWALKGINARRGGKRFFFDITSLRYDREGGFFAAGIRLNTFFGGDYRMDMNVVDELDAAEPRLSTALRRPSRLVQEMSGVFRYTDLPGGARTLVVFHGEARTHWVFYYLLPLALLRDNIEERVGILIRNTHDKALEKG